MNQKETYFYGQGRVLIATRLADGTPGAWRWAGDVSAFNFELSTEDVTHKESWSGQRATARKFNIGKEGTLNATFHDHSPDNFALLLYSTVLTKPAATGESKTLPAGIKAGERYSLGYLNVSNVVIGLLTEGTDYIVDKVYGAVEFLTDQAAAPTATFDYAEHRLTPMFTKTPEDVAVRYEGINLAENGAPVVAEFYRVQFSPTSGIDLINNDSSLNGLESTAGILFDSTQADNGELGRYGRIITG